MYFRGKKLFLFIFSTAHSHGDDLQRFIAEETIDRGDSGTAHKNLRKRKKFDRENCRESRIFGNFTSKNFCELELRLYLGKNFRKKCQKRENRETLCPRKFLP